MKSNSNLRPHQATLLLASLATLAGMLLPGLKRVLLPLVYLNTHLHEMSHAIVAQITGAQVQRILVNADGSGVTPVLGGNMFLIASAGYLGASLFGAGMIYLGRDEKGARTTLACMTALLATSMIVWVRGDAAGVFWGFVWVAALACLAIFVKGRALVFCCQFLGMQQCLNAVLALFALVQLSTATEVHSDASILQESTGIPAVVWACLWTLFSLALLTSTMKRAWREPPKST